MLYKKGSNIKHAPFKLTYVSINYFYGKPQQLTFIESIMKALNPGFHIIVRSHKRDEDSLRPPASVSRLTCFHTVKRNSKRWYESAKTCKEGNDFESRMTCVEMLLFLLDSDARVTNS